MPQNANKIRLIFGLKIKQLRMDKGYSLSELAQRVAFSVSYLNEIEKGKKYPKADKIIALAHALGTDYDTLVSLKLSKKLEPINDLLESDLVSDLPFEMFGIEVADFLELMSAAPSKLSAFISTIGEISRNYGLSTEQFYFSVLRSYQEMHDNYFVEIEDAARRFMAEVGWTDRNTVLATDLQKVLEEKFQYQIVSFDENSQPDLMSLRSVWVKNEHKLLINNNLTQEQLAFTLGREVGYQFMKVRNRPSVSSVVEVSSFEEAFNNFKASYFARAVLINRTALIGHVEQFFAQTTWNPASLSHILGQFNATPEMLLHRITTVLTSYFGINQLFFLRFNHHMGEDAFQMNKELHLAQLHSPHGTVRAEHYCRRWVAIDSLRSLETLRQNQHWSGEPLFAAQISTFINTQQQYLVCSIAKPSPPNRNRNSSVSIGFVIDEKLKSRVRFLTDPALNQKDVNQTCERCSWGSCPDRAAPAYIFEQNKTRQRLKEQLSGLGV